MLGISGSGTSTPGYSAPGLSSSGSSAPFSSKYGPFLFGPLNLVLDIDVLNGFSHCHPHLLRMAKIFTITFFTLNLLIFSLMQLLFLQVLKLSFSILPCKIH